MRNHLKNFAHFSKFFCLFLHFFQCAGKDKDILKLREDFNDQEYRVITRAVCWLVLSSPNYIGDCFCLVSDLQQVGNMEKPFRQNFWQKYWQLFSSITLSQSLSGNSWLSPSPEPVLFPLQRQLRAPFEEFHHQEEVGIFWTSLEVISKLCPHQSTPDRETRANALRLEKRLKLEHILDLIYYIIPSFVP